MEAGQDTVAAALPDRLTAVPPASANLRLIPVTTQDHGLIRQWLRDPAVQAWWGNASAAEAEVAGALDDSGALSRIIALDGAPIGYAHAVDAGELNRQAPDHFLPGSYDCDVFIGVAAHRGRGYGHSALVLLAQEVFETTLALSCSIVVPLRNEAAVRAYERAGFHWSKVWQDPVAGPSWVMVRERPANRR